jgi:hypothetical protein
MLAIAAVSRAHARGDPRLDLELAFGVSGSTELRTVVMTSPLVTISAPVSGDASFVSQWGFTVATGEPTDPTFASTSFVLGNPLVGWAILFSEGFVFAPSLTLPVASRPDAEHRRPASEFALSGGLGLRGAVDPWLWAPDEFSIVLPLSYVAWLDPVLIETHAKVGFLFPTKGPDADTDFVLQLQLRLAAHLGAGVWLAAGLSAVYTSTDVDKFQAALSPELRFVIGPGSHLGITLLMNLDTPYGPFSEPGRFWGVHITASARL